MTAGEGLVEAVTGLVGVSVAAGDIEGVSPAENPAVAMAEVATACAVEAEAELAEAPEAAVEGVTTEAST